MVKLKEAVSRLEWELLKLEASHKRRSPRLSVENTFVPYIHKLNYDRMEGQTMKFVDDTKLYRVIRSKRDAEALQKDV